MKNRAIEFYKYIAACIIFVLHFSKYTTWEKSTGYFNGGYLAVEFFFIVSGFLMMQGLEKKAGDLSLGKETARFIESRYKRLYPPYIIAILIVVAINFLIKDNYHLISRLFKGVPELLALQVFIRPKALYGPLWFVSAVIWAGALVYFLIKKYGDSATHVILPLTFFMFMGWSYRQFGHLDLAPSTEPFFSTFFRGFAEIGLGASLYHLTRYLEPKIKACSSAIVGLIELLAFAATMYIMWGYRHSYMDYAFLAVVSLLVVLSFIGHGFWSKILDNPISGFLGGLSYSMYLCQGIFQDICINIFPGHNFWVMTLINLVLLTVFAIFFKMATEALQRKLFQ